MKASVLALFIACIVVAPVGAQQVYSWTDANGVKHFSDTPPPSSVKESKKLNVQGAPVSEDAAAETDAAPKEGPKMAAAAGYSPEDIKRNCEIAQKNLASLERARPAEGADVDTQVTFQTNIGKAQDQVKLFCG